MRLHEFLNMTYNFESLWNFLSEKKVIRNEIKKSKVSKVSKFIISIVYNFKISAFHGTWFEQTHMDLRKVCRFLMLQSSWYKFLKTELELNDKAIVDWTNFCREVRTKNNTGCIIRRQWIFGGIKRCIKNVFILPYHFTKSIY
ncbi:hypothetical protein P5V15_002586 [Pogonomyrmex californicus]